MNAGIAKLDKDCEQLVHPAVGSDPICLATPRKGYVLSTAAETYGAPLRFAASLIAEAAPPILTEVVWQRLYARRRPDPGADQVRTPTELTAWMTLGAWVLGIATGALREDANLLEAESWFIGDVADSGFIALVPSRVRLNAERALREIADQKALRDLLPYVLDPHGEGSRISVMLRPETAQARATKRANGVFYTPADVAGFMANAVIRSLGEDAVPLTVFDPACGSGVFLRAVLSELQRRSPDADAFDLACSCLYGTDIDPWAVNAAAIVLLADCSNVVQTRGIAPLAAWHALRLNLAHVDALRLDPGTAVSPDDPERRTRLACRAMLKAGRVPDVSAKGIAAAGPLKFSAIFPEISEGARIVIGNPPYANIGPSDDLLTLSKRFETFQAAPMPTSDKYPLFVEQMIRLTAPNAHGGAMVLPLSIACNTGRQFRALRQKIARTPGHWQFAFFDREPHALFGENVKTRNAIVVWTRHCTETDVEISTGPLRKWRGEDRARMLDSVRFTSISADIRPGIPKIEGMLQAVTLCKLLAQPNLLQHEVTRIGRATLSEALHADASTVFVASTAYNFLSVFLRPQTLLTEDRSLVLSENPMLALSCPSHEVALQVFACLSSRVAFWWWHAHGDGFHVSKYLIETMPVGEALRSPFFIGQLTRLGHALWEEVSASPIISRNRGRTTLGFSAAASPLRAQIDALLIEALGLSSDLTSELQRFCNGVIHAHVLSRTEQEN